MGVLVILDEHGNLINQIATEEHTPSHVMTAFFKVAYERDPEFKASIDELVESVVKAVNEMKG